MAMPLSAKKAVPALTTEEEKQFLYYFYASRDAINQQDYARALLLLEFCRQLNPQEALVLDNLGVINTALGNLQDAEKLYAEAYKLSPDECWQHYADHLLASGAESSLKTARKVMEETLKRRPNDAVIAEYLLQIYVRDQLWKQALAMQDKIDAISGYDGNSALNRYRIYYQWGKWQKAVEEIDKYLEEDPTSVYFLLLRADIYIRTNQLEEAYNLCTRIVKLFPLSEQEYGMLKQNRYCAYYISVIKAEEGDSLMHIGEKDRAYEAYEASLYFFPNNKYTLNNYAYMLAIHGGDIKKAERMSELTIKDEPDNAVYLDTYGWILHLQGQNSLALFYLRKALENVDDDRNRNVIQEHIRAIEK